MELVTENMLKYIRRTKFQVLKNNHFKCRQAFAMTNNMASSDLWKMLYLSVLYLPQIAQLAVPCGDCCHAGNMADGKAIHVTKPGAFLG